MWTTLWTVLGCGSTAPAPEPPAPPDLPGVHVSVGAAVQVHDGLVECGAKSRTSAVGNVTATDGTTWVVPAATSYLTAAKAPDLYNECGGVTRAGLAELDLSTIPVVDAGGSEAFVAYVFADNYFEFYANGTLIGVDAVPFTPFNSSVLRFTAERPVTIAMKLVDWEENLGLGTEAGRGSPYHPGDAGVVVHIQDSEGKTQLVTDASWRAQTFYIAPLYDPSCLEVDGEVRRTTSCSVDGVADGSRAMAAFWDRPEDWMSPGFDDTAWPSAVLYTNETVGVNNKPAYTHFTEVFDAPGTDPSFIWTSNLVLDNLVLARARIY